MGVRGDSVSHLLVGLLFLRLSTRLIFLVALAPLLLLLLLLQLLLSLLSLVALASCWEQFFKKTEPVLFHYHYAIFS